MNNQTVSPPTNDVITLMRGAALLNQVTRSSSNSNVGEKNVEKTNLNKISYKLTPIDLSILTPQMFLENDEVIQVNRKQHLSKVMIGTYDAKTSRTSRTSSSEEQSVWESGGLDSSLVKRISVFNVFRLLRLTQQ